MESICVEQFSIAYIDGLQIINSAFFHFTLGEENFKDWSYLCRPYFHTDYKHYLQHKLSAIPTNNQGNNSCQNPNLTSTQGWV